MKLTNKIALVTGASRGIGKAIADTLVNNGATVIGTATSQEQADNITARFSKFNGMGKVLQLSDKANIEEVIKSTEKEYGAIDILVNNAGITRDNLLMRMKDEEWQDVLDINLNSLFVISKAVIRGMMRKKSGRIINLTSVVGIMGNAGQINYAASKGGIIAFSKSLAREVGSRNITVNCVAPGFVVSDMTKDLPEEIKDTLLKNLPLGRFGEPQDIANTVLFLASDLADYITGQTINVNGGLLMP